MNACSLNSVDVRSAAAMARNRICEKMSVIHVSVTARAIAVFDHNQPHCKLYSASVCAAEEQLHLAEISFCTHFSRPPLAMIS